MGEEDRRGSGGLLHRLGALPWWAWFALAFLIYALLHMVATRTRVVVMDSAQVSGAIAGLLLGAIADAMQYIIPFLLLVAAAWLRWMRRETLAAEAAWRSSEGPCAMSQKEFDDLTQPDELR
jgi:hypothetical protein